MAIHDGDLVVQAHVSVLVGLIVMMLDNVLMDVHHHIGENFAACHVSAKMEQPVTITLVPALVVVVMDIGAVIVMKNVSVTKRQTVRTKLDIVHRDVQMDVGEENVISFVIAMVEEYVLKRLERVQMDVL